MSANGAIGASVLTDLYTTEPGEFVARRTAIVKSLRAEGGRDVAKAVAALRRPSAAQWSLNLVAGQAPSLVARWLDAAEAVEAAQAAAFRGKEAAVRDSLRELREASAAVVARAQELSREARSAVDTGSLAAVLADVAASGAAREQFRAGHLGATAIAASDPFASPDGGADQPVPRHARAADPKPARRQDDSHQEAARLRRELDDARRAQATASELLAQATDRADEARDHVARLEEQLREAHAHRDAAAKEQTRAARTLEEAERARLAADAALQAQGDAKPAPRS